MLTPSKEAYEKIAPHITALEQIVLDAITDYGAMIPSELPAVTGKDYASVSPRPGQLYRKGLLVRVGRRPNDKGNNEWIYDIRR